MHRRGLILLVAITAVVMIAAFLPGAPDPGDAAPSANILLPALADHPGAAAVIALSGGGRHVTLTRQDAQGPWVVAERGGYRADQGKVGQALLGLARLRPREAETRRPDLYARLGVEDPSAPDSTSVLVRVSDPAGSALGEIIVGRHRADRFGGGNDGTYVRAPGAAQAWLAEGAVDISSLAPAWLDPLVAEIPASRVRQILTVEPDGSRLVLDRTAAADEFLLADAAADAKYARAFRRNDLAGLLDGLALTDVRAAAGFGAPAGEIVTTEWTTFDGLNVTGTLMEKDGTHWLRLTADGATPQAREEARRLEAEWSPWVFGVAKASADMILIKRSDILQPAKGS